MSNENHQPDETTTAWASKAGVVGHQEILSRFATTLQRGRLASTYLFVGPEGVGKRFTATAIAKSLLCTTRTDGSDALVDRSPTHLGFCGTCESCRLMDLGTHPDFFLLSKPVGKSSLPISHFLGDAEHRHRTGLCHDISMKPMVSPRRIAVIDDADDFSVESANCLLKTLEEPPPGALIFLVGTSLSKQLPTIRSRAQVVRFMPLGEAEIQQILLNLPIDQTDETVEPISAEEATDLARSCGGSVTRAFALRDPGLREARIQVEQALSAARINPLQLAALLEEQTKTAGTEPSLRRARFRELIRGMVEYYTLQLNQLENDDQVLRSLDVCFQAEADLGRNANQSALVQQLATQLWRIQSNK